jgi:3'-phosphoadenosine 5'-phosphosulfate sulfotransferase (PAPS reductase)/FAD synthetase
MSKSNEHRTYCDYCGNPHPPEKLLSVAPFLVICGDCFDPNNIEIPNETLKQSWAMIDEAVEEYKLTHIYSLLSGGHDSITATHLASFHPKFAGVIHINTGTGIPETTQYVRETCKQYGWELIEVKPFIPYEGLLMKYGFPTSALHGFFYQRLKERPVRAAVKQIKKEHNLGHRGKVGLISGVRKQESQKRMMINDTPYAEGSRVWIPIIAEWSSCDCNHYMENNTVPRNPVKDALGMSGECLCGANAQKDEYKLIKSLYPETGKRIDAWESIVSTAWSTGVLDIPAQYCRWGNGRRASDDQLELPGMEVGHMCSACDGKTDIAKLKLGLDI